MDPSQSHFVRHVFHQGFSFSRRGNCLRKNKHSGNPAGAAWPWHPKCCCRNQQLQSMCSLPPVTFHRWELSSDAQSTTGLEWAAPLQHVCVMRHCPRHMDCSHTVLWLKAWTGTCIGTHLGGDQGSCVASCRSWWAASQSRRLGPVGIHTTRGLSPRQKYSQLRRGRDTNVLLKVKHVKMSGY